MPTFTTPAPITVALDTPAGQVRLIAADRTDTVVEVRPADAGKSRDARAAEQTTVEFADGTLQVRTPVKNQVFGSSGAVEVTVQLPTGSRVEAAAGGTELRGVGRLGEVVVESAFGPVKFDEAAGMRLNTTGGVEVGRLDGPAEITAQQGDIRVGEATGGTLVLSTQDGGVSVGAAVGVSAVLDAGTSLGRVHNALKNTEGASAPLRIRATTVRGDISAHSL
ncbi:hypothetical protein DFP74_4481 [Nocardiopsis sp. Huas11]|uniref:DUF4097 family beta strand repeat-containing protein n=1 Tax=Nocardiopsis sp. Huas11 TaxID=2183912 RepID=UPI000EB04EB3|nr:DUF4097 family beta strand repeat-containing protein [Nocardiopsis sp. Huas11]RKS08759.1 hypothetical protein DFP74_4481 [Nocardiopsis sp. Huas11]